MFSPESTKLALDILQNEIPFAIWETVYVTIISTFLALVVGLPLGVLLVVGEKDGIRHYQSLYYRYLMRL